MPTSSLLANDHSLTPRALEDGALGLLPMNVLVVDDDPVMRHIASMWLREQTVCRVVSDADQALQALHEQVWDVFFVDLNLGGGNASNSGLNLVHTLQQHQPQAAWVLMTAHGAQHEFSRAVNLGVGHILLKPFRREALLRTVEKIDLVRQNREALKQTRKALEEQNRVLQSMRRQEQRLAALAQKYLLFYVPDHEIQGLQISSAAKAQEGASGDLVDVVATEKGLSVVCGDVMGKGLGAAIVSAGIKTALAQVRLSKAAATPGALLTSVREKIEPMLFESESLLTLLVADIDTEAGLLTLVDCGAPFVFLQRAHSGHIVFAHGDMMPLGIRYEPLQTTLLPLLPEDRLLILSDGVLDARGVTNTNEAYGHVADQLMRCTPGLEDRLAETLVQQTCMPGGIADDRSCVVVSCTDDLPVWRKVVHRLFTFELSSLAELREWFEAEVSPWLAGRDHEASETWLALCLLGITELTSNVIKHAQVAHTGGREPGQQLGITLILDDRAVWIEWQYRGQIFRPAPGTLRRAPAPAALAESGYGLSIIDRVFERVHYFTGVTHSQTIVVFKTAPRHE